MPTTNGHGPKRAVLWAILYARVSTDEQARSATPSPSSLKPYGSTPPVKATRS